MARGRPSRIDIAKPDIVNLFESSAQKIYWPAELASILAQHRGNWRLTQATNARNFVEYLIAKARLKEVRLAAENYPEAKALVRYIWGGASAYALALSLMRRRLAARPPIARVSSLAHATGGRCEIRRDAGGHCGRSSLCSHTGVQCYARLAASS